MTGDEEIVQQAKREFKRAEDHESLARNHFIQDVKFGTGDTYNRWQWPDDVAAARGKTEKSMLTVNKTEVHCMHIVNDARQNKIGIAVRPVGNEATEEAANVLEGVIRHIEYQSNAQLAYDAATWNQVFGGIGYIRVHVDYVSEDGFEQDIFIKRVGDPLSILLDPDIQEYDGSDAKFGFVFENVLRKDIEDKYPRYKDQVDAPGLDGDEWCTIDHVRVCEYWRRGEKTDRLLLLTTGETMRESGLPPGAYDELKSVGAIAKERKISEPLVEWFKIIGNKVVDRKPWLGRYIPIARVVGQEVTVDGQMDRKGHVRALIDPQRMYNYHSSGSVEFVGLQTKTPFVAPVAAIEGYETEWSRANLDNLPVLPWNHVDDQGNAIPRPERVVPPQSAGGHIEGMKVAQEEMMLVSGQYQAIMGAQSNETSGKAINARQRQGENATYHFIDHLALAVRFVGRIVLDLIPKVYDTKRVLQVLGRDDSIMKVEVDPGAPQPHQKVQDPEADDYNPAKIAAILNPNVGRYDVISDVGPSYGTQRQEAFNAFSQILSQNKEAFMLVGDLWAESADFPGSDKMADRLKNMIPQQAKGGPSPEEQARMMAMQEAAQEGQQQIEQLHGALQAANQKLADQTEDLRRKDFEAETDRMAAVGKIDPEALKPVIREMVSQLVGEAIVPLMAKHAAADQAMLPADQAMLPAEPEMVDG